MTNPRKIAEFTSGARRVTVRFAKDYNEYRCRLIVADVPMPAADYFTDSRDDALATAKRMAETESHTAPDIPRSVCTCGHTGDGPNSDHAGAIGHGACYVLGCPCAKFTWHHFRREFSGGKS